MGKTHRHARHFAQLAPATLDDGTLTHHLQCLEDSLGKLVRVVHDLKQALTPSGSLPDFSLPVDQVLMMYSMAYSPELLHVMTVPQQECCRPQLSYQRVVQSARYHLLLGLLAIWLLAKL